MPNMDGSCARCFYASQKLDKHGDRSRGTGLISLYDFGFINVIAWALTGVVKSNRNALHNLMTVKENGLLLR